MWCLAISLISACCSVLKPGELYYEACLSADWLRDSGLWHYAEVFADVILVLARGLVPVAVTFKKQFGSCQVGFDVADVHSLYPVAGLFTACRIREGRLSRPLIVGTIVKFTAGVSVSEGQAFWRAGEGCRGR